MRHSGPHVFYTNLSTVSRFRCRNPDNVQQTSQNDLTKSLKWNQIKCRLGIRAGNNNNHHHLTYQIHLESDVPVSTAWRG